jgi:hypothetical protein
MTAVPCGHRGRVVWLLKRAEVQLHKHARCQPVQRDRGLTARTLTRCDIAIALGLAAFWQQRCTTRVL